MKTFDKTIIAFIFFILIIMLFDSMKDNKNLELKLSDLRSDKIELDSLYQWKSERLKNYTLISLEQSKELDRFQSSRNSSKKNVTLQKLQTKLY